MKKFLSLLKSGWFIALVGLLLLSLLIWLGGPYLGIGDSQPLASPVTRLVVIIVLLAVWVVALQIQQMRLRSKPAQMSGDIAGQDAGAASTGVAGDDRSAGERAQLATRFQEAVDTLRKSKHGGGNLYTLPWYVVIGPPGSGKSTLLQNSGLNFPLSDRFGKQALRGIGGTRNCDWWFTDEAVFLDTAGRYTTQDSDRNADASAWAEFLKLLRRYRKRRPINGVVIAMSMSDLLVLDDNARYEHVQAVRRRLDELAEHLRIGVPVYLVLTKCDLIAGFSEFFDDLTPSCAARCGACRSRSTRPWTAPRPRPSPTSSRSCSTGSTPACSIACTPRTIAAAARRSCRSRSSSVPCAMWRGSSWKACLRPIPMPASRCCAGCISPRARRKARRSTA